MLPPQEWLTYKELNGIEINLNNGTIRPYSGGPVYTLPANSREFYPSSPVSSDPLQTETVLGNGSSDGQSVEVLQSANPASEAADSEGLPKGS